jgi:hypothetical protein
MVTPVAPSTSNINDRLQCRRHLKAEEGGATLRFGNELLRRFFEHAHSGSTGRDKIPPILVFAQTGEWRDVRFLGLAVIRRGV